MNRTGEGSRPWTSPYHALLLVDKHRACINNLRLAQGSRLAVVATTHRVVTLTDLPSCSHSPAQAPR